MKIDQQLSTGIRSIDGLIPIANGNELVFSQAVVFLKVLLWE